ncbi:nuclease-related domain-containing protein [Heyndrickxia sp. MSNUG]|uniref:nuclease-related domain-containing protein n=1 Tax=Heyndrickxia sp. MSNUG TaxID=3136677 RepID=UPI003C30C24C
MFYKERKIPLKFRAEEAIIRRLDSTHPKFSFIQENHRKMSAGIRGEKELDYQLGFLPNEKYLILNDLRLQQNGHFFQIDTLLLSPKASFIIDSKNISGTVLFDFNLEQCLRIFNDKEEGIRDPITQVRTHKRLLSQWLIDNKLGSIPLEYLVVMTHATTVIKTHGNSTNKNRRLLHSDQLYERLIEFEKRYTNENLTLKEIKKIGKQLLKSHTPLLPKILSAYSIDPFDIKPGVQCPSCLAIPMNRQHGKWFCNNCGCKSKDAHISAITDYSLIFSQTISLSQFRNFLLIPESKVKMASDLLVSLKLPHHGTKKGRVYDLSPLMKI